MFYLLQYTVLYVGSFYIFFKTLFVLREGPLSAPKFYFYVQYLAPVCANMIQILVHTVGARGVPYLQKLMLKDSQTLRPPQSVQHSILLSTYSAKHNYFKISFQKVCVFQAQQPGGNQGAGKISDSADCLKRQCHEIFWHFIFS